MKLGKLKLPTAIHSRFRGFISQSVKKLQLQERPNITFLLCQSTSPTHNNKQAKKKNIKKKYRHFHEVCSKLLENSSLKQDAGKNIKERRKENKKISQYHVHKQSSPLNTIRKIQASCIEKKIKKIK